MDALAQQVLPAAVRVRHQTSLRVVDDPAVDLLGHPVVEAAVAGLHVEDGDAHALGARYAERPLSVSPRTSRRSGSLRRAPASTPARIRPDPRPRTRSPSIAEVAIGRAHAELLEEDVAERSGRSSGRCGRASWSQWRSSRSITRLSRMISGRVPRTVRTFIARAAAASPGSMPWRSSSSRSAVAVDHFVRRAVLTPVERLAVALARAAARAASAGSRVVAALDRSAAPPPRRPGPRGSSRRAGCP